MKTTSRTKFSVLGMLSLSKMTGYEIRKTIENSTNHFWSESEGQMYPALSQCVKDKLATCKEIKSKDNARTKKEYALTKKGREELTRWLKQPPKPSLVRNELLLKLFFGGNVDTNETVFQLMHQQKKLETELKIYKTTTDNLKIKYKNSPHLKYWLMTLDYGIEMAKSELAWCKKSLKLLKN